MKEFNISTTNEHPNYHFKRSAFLALIISLVQNRAIVWAILNGDMSNWYILAIVTILLIIGAVSGEYLFGRWMREKFINIVNRSIAKNDNAN